MLAGGLGRRMAAGRDEVDKGLVELDGLPLAAHVAARLAPQVDTLRISANRNRDRYRALGFETVGDLLPGQPGPLAGIHAALENMQVDWLAAAPCDAPRVPADLVERLRAAAREAHARVAVARSGGRAHWTHLLLHRDLRGAIESFLLEGGRPVRDWCARQRCAFADFEDEDAFFNVNTPADLVRIASR